MINTAEFSNRIWQATSKSGADAWEQGSYDVKNAQSEYLLALMRTNAKSQYGQIFGFDRIRGPEDYQYQVPSITYDDLVAAMEAIESGEQGVLTTENIFMLEPTSGSTGGEKLIPYTKALKEEFQYGISAWIYFMFKEYPNARKDKAYWSATPALAEKRYTNGGLPIGFDEDASYLPWYEQLLFNQISATPSELSKITDPEAFKFATAHYLLSADDLAFISVWNPTYLLTLLHFINDNQEALIRAIADGNFGNFQLNEIGISARGNKKRAADLFNIFNDEQYSDKTRFEKVWPRLALISCWGDAFAKQHMEILSRSFPNVPIQPKGLLSTEAFTSFPIGDQEGAALSIRSHFFEFLDSNGNVHLAHELNQDVEYEVIVSTSGGLYRYKTGDSVHVVGHHNQCPLIKFLGKVDKTVDLVGEKLNERFVQECVNEVLSNSSIPIEFRMIAPQQSDDDRSYVLYIELEQGKSIDTLDTSQLNRIREEIESRFRQNPYYSHAVDFGQLKKLRIFIVNENAGDTYLKVCSEKLGQRLGDIKPSVLHHYTDWANEFDGSFLNLQA